MKKSSRPDKIEIIVPEKVQGFLLHEKIGQGSFGEIYKGQHEKTNEIVAVKFETRVKRQSYLFFEGKLYEHFWAFKKKHNISNIGLPEVYFYGRVNDYNVMIMQILGPALSDLFTKCDKQFSLKTVLMVAPQMITRIEYVHNCSYIHRDIKPNNFLMG